MTDRDRESTDFEREVAAMLHRRAGDITEGEAADRILPRREPVRRRLPQIAAAIALLAAVSLGVWIAADRDGDSTVVTSADGQTDATPGSVVAAEPPAPERTTGARTTLSLPREDERSSSGIAGLSFDDETTIYIPAGWEPLSMRASYQPEVGQDPDRILSLTLGNGGPFDDVVQADFVEGIDYTRVGNPGSSYTDVVDELGRTVRLRAERTDGSLAVVDLGEDALTVEGHGIDDETLLAVIDHLVATDGSLSLTDPSGLPAGLERIELPNSGAFEYLQLSLRRDETSVIELLVFPENSWRMAMNARQMHVDSEPIEAFGGSGIAYDYSPNSGDNPGAIVVEDGRIHQLVMHRWGPSDLYPSLQEVLAVLDSSQARTLGSIADELGYQDRAAVVGDWLEETPLPDDADLSWLLLGPPIDPAIEASFVHKVVACSWVGEWLKSGASVALVQLDDESSWPTAAVLDAQALASAGLPGRYSGIDVDRYQEAASIAERAEVVAIDCGFVIDVDALAAQAPIARIVIPQIDVDLKVVDDVGPEALRGTVVGHYPNTSLPGEAGNAAIAGHRTTYGAPFMRLDELEAGASIFVITVSGAFEYRVTSSEVTDPEDISVLGDFGDNRLTLTTEHPEYSARERLVVVGELVGPAVESPPSADDPND